jgi:hypothetical protein
MDALVVVREGGCCGIDYTWWWEESEGRKDGGGRSGVSGWKAVPRAPNEKSLAIERNAVAARPQSRPAGNVAYSRF